MNELYFSSQLSSSYLVELENILHFNAHQHKVSRSIADSVAVFGLPEIMNENGFLKIQMSGGAKPQILYVFDSYAPDAALLAVTIQHRTSYEELTILHIALDTECSSSGKYAEEMILIRILEKIKNDVRRIKGLKRIQIPYIHRAITL